MTLPHNRKCPVDMMHPRPVGVCDRTGFLVYLDDMDWQYQYTGKALTNLRILVAQEYLDKPAEFLQPAILGPEPAPDSERAPDELRNAEFGRHKSTDRFANPA